MVPDPCASLFKSKGLELWLDYFSWKTLCKLSYFILLLSKELLITLFNDTISIIKFVLENFKKFVRVFF